MIIIAEPPVAPAAAPAAAATVPVVATPAPPPPAAPQMDAEVSLGAIVAAALGPLPQVCPEHVLLDMERARMTAEDLRVAAISPYYTYAAPRGPRRRLMTWREVAIRQDDVAARLGDHLDNMRTDLEAVAVIVRMRDRGGATDMGGRPLTDDDHFAAIRAGVGAYHEDTEEEEAEQVDNEDDEEDDEEMAEEDDLSF